MLEILGLMAFCKWIGSTLRSKGQAPLPFQIMGVTAYYGCAFGTALIYGAQAAGDQPLFDGSAIMVALLGGLMGLAGVALLAAALPQVKQHQADESIPVLLEESASSVSF